MFIERYRQARDWRPMRDLYNEVGRRHLKSLNDKMFLCSRTLASVVATKAAIRRGYAFSAFQLMMTPGIFADVWVAIAED